LIDAGAAYFLETRDGESPSVTIAKKANETVTTAFCLHEGGGIAEIIIPGLVSALGCCRFKDSAAGNSDSNDNSVNFGAGSKAGNHASGGYRRSTLIRINGYDVQDLIIELSYSGELTHVGSIVSR
jgi:hypothetical protein